MWLPLTRLKEDSPFEIKSEGLRPPLNVSESTRTNSNNQGETQVPLPPIVDAFPLASTSGGQSGNAAHRAKQRSARKRVSSHHTANKVVVELPPDDEMSLRQRELEVQQKELSSSAEQDRLKLAEALRRIEQLEILVAKFTAADCESSSVESEVVPAAVEGFSHASLESDILAKDFVPFVHFETGRNLDESVWEASLFVFLPDLGLMSSVCTVAAVFLSAVTQFTICVVTFVGFRSESFPSLDEAKSWRYGSAHDAIWTTAVTDSSLASRVCAQDSSLSVSTGQANLVQDVELYLSSVLSIPQGGLLCVVACLMWFHLVLAELLKAGNFWLGTCALWMGSRRRGVRETELHCKGDIVTFAGFGTRRFLFICVIVAVRVMIALSLLYTGILWLLNTTSIEDIVLNAAALGFVMDLDEVLFVTSVAEPAKAILRKMEPLCRVVTPPLRLCGRKAGTDFIFPCFSWIGFAVLLGLVLPVITDNVETMRDLQYQLCGGNLDFVVQVMPSTDVVLVRESTPFVSSLQDSFELNALEELVWTANFSSVLLSLFTDTDYWFSLRQSQDIATFSNWLSLCSDFQFENSLTRKVGDLLALPDTWRCSDIDQDECWILNNTLLRYTCPSTCGCDNPQSPQFMLSAAYGCPEDACRTGDSYRSALNQISCTSPDVEDLQENVNWTQYVDNMVTWGAGLGVNASHLAPLLFSSGCAAAALPLLQELFGLGRDLSLAHWCPEEMGCRAPRTSNVVDVYPGHCPPQCDAWRANYLEKLASWPCVDSSAAEFASGSAADFLTFHLNTFIHVFRDWSVDLLRSHGCGDLPTEWCGFPYYLRAVCPVTCGCGSNDGLFLCPGSCISFMATASERNSAPSLGSTSTTPLPSRSTTFLVNSSTATIETTHQTLSPSTAATSIGNTSSQFENSSIRHQSNTSLFDVNSSALDA